MVTVEDANQPNSLPSTSRPSSEATEETEPKGLKASLLQDRESTLRWVDEAPLRLVAATLVDANRRTAKVADIKTALTREIVKPQDWNRWWTIVRFGLRESRHFSYGPREPIRLRTSNLTEVDSDSLDDLRKAARKAPSQSVTPRESSGPAPNITGLGGWILWVQSDEEEPMPRSTPSPDFVTFLQRLPESVTPKAVARLSSGIEQRVIDSKQRPAENSVEMWQEALMAALDRWSELSYPPGVSVREIVALTVRVLEILGSMQFEDVVAWIATYSSKSAGNAESVSDSLLSVTYEAPNGTERLLTRMSRLLDSSTRVALWQRLLNKGLMLADKPPMGQWLRILEHDDKSEIFSEVLATVRDDSSITGLYNLLETEWKLADSKQRHRLFDAIALAWALHWRSKPDSKAAMIEAISEADSEWEGEESLLSEWRSLVRFVSESEVRRVHDYSEQRVADLERQLKETEAELDRTVRQVRFLQGENRSKRSAAELEISRDAITVLGIALQDLAVSAAPKSQELGDLESKITLALSTLGGSPFGDIGEIVPFDPVLHAATPTPVTGTSVKIVAPGLKYSRRSDNPVNLMKVRVEEEGRE